METKTFTTRADSENYLLQKVENCFYKSVVMSQMFVPVYGSIVGC